MIHPVFWAPAAAKSSADGFPGAHERQWGVASNEVHSGKLSIFSKAKQKHESSKKHQGFLTKSFFFFWKSRRQFVCLKNSKDEKIRHRSNGAMVGEEFEKENKPQFWRLQKKIQMRNGPGNIIRLSLAWAGLHHGHEQQDGLPWRRGWRRRSNLPPWVWERRIPPNWCMILLVKQQKFLRKWVWSSILVPN